MLMTAQKRLCKGMLRGLQTAKRKKANKQSRTVQLLHKQFIADCSLQLTQSLRALQSKSVSLSTKRDALQSQNPSRQNQHARKAGRNLQRTDPHRRNLAQ